VQVACYCTSAASEKIPLVVSSVHLIRPLPHEGQCALLAQISERQIAKHNGVQQVSIRRMVYHKKDAHVEVDAEDLDMSGEDGPATGDHGEAELLLPNSASVSTHRNEWIMREL
jgi:hypothetical protein